VSFGALIVMTFFGAFVEVAFVIWDSAFYSVSRMRRYCLIRYTNLSMDSNSATLGGHERGRAGLGVGSVAREREPKRGAWGWVMAWGWGWLVSAIRLAERNL
jgi:hypothetical protein